MYSKHSTRCLDEKKTVVLQRCRPRLSATKPQLPEEEPSTSQMRLQRGAVEQLKLRLEKNGRLSGFGICWVTFGMDWFRFRWFRMVGWSVGVGSYLFMMGKDQKNSGVSAWRLEEVAKTPRDIF